MDTESEKQQIIYELMNVREEWIIRAIKHLHELEEDDNISDDHKKILEERLKMYDANPDDVLDWESIKDKS